MITIPPAHNTKKTFNVSYYAMPGSRKAFAGPVVEGRLLHRLFVWSYLPVSWGRGKLIVFIGLVALGVGLIWWPFGTSTAAVAAGIYLFFTVTDGLLLWWLPYAGRSFGPFAPVLLVKTQQIPVWKNREEKI